MGNENNRHVVLISQLQEHIQYRGPRACIDHGGRFIRNQQPSDGA